MAELVEQLEPPSAQRPVRIDGEREELVFLRLLGPSCAGYRIPSFGGTLGWMGAVIGVGGHHVQEKTWPACRWGGHKVHATSVETVGPLLEWHDGRVLGCHREARLRKA
eukprot:SM000053S17501  [mRNA]  locus=s53:635348:635700:- [translate_table: standard]